MVRDLQAGRSKLPLAVCPVVKTGTSPDSEMATEPALAAILGAARVCQIGAYSTAVRQPGKSGSDLIT